jgi:hypothetical protein
MAADIHTIAATFSSVWKLDDPSGKTRVFELIDLPNLQSHWRPTAELDAQSPKAAAIATILMTRILIVSTAKCNYNNQRCAARKGIDF